MRAIYQDIGGYNELSVLNTLEPQSGDSGDSGGATQTVKSGIVDIPNGDQTIAVTFGSAFPDDTWQFGELIVVNTVDGSPLNLVVGLISAKSASGFTVNLTAPTDSANYDLHYRCVPG